MKEDLTKALQENVLTLLCLDPENCFNLRNMVDYQNFDDGVYQTFAKRAVDYIDTYKTCPGEHLSDILEDKLTGDDSRKARIYDSVLRNLFAAYETINKKYVLDKVTDFVSKQVFKAAISNSLNHVESGDIESAKLIMEKAMKHQTLTFDPGLSMFSEEAFSYLDEQVETIPIGK